METRTTPMAPRPELRPERSLAVSPVIPQTRVSQPAAGTASAGNSAAPRPLDLRGMEPPLKLSEARLEDLTIDGICGVY